MFLSAMHRSAKFGTSALRMLAVVLFCLAVSRKAERNRHSGPSSVDFEMIGEMPHSKKFW